MTRPLMGLVPRIHIVTTVSAETIRRFSELARTNESRGQLIDRAMDALEKGESPKGDFMNNLKNIRVSFTSPSTGETEFFSGMNAVEAATSSSFMGEEIRKSLTPQRLALLEAVKAATAKAHDLW
jgi:hypothetical protein